MVNETDNWPSLREAAERDWDFCSEPESEEFWEDLPEPALAIELEPSGGTKPEQQQDAGATSWLLVREGEPTEPSDVGPSNEVVTKATFADMLRERLASESEQTLSPAAQRTPMPPLHARSLQRRSRSASELGSTKEPTLCEEDEQLDLEMHVPQWHGWMKEHKASWSARQQRKVAEKKGQRLAQRRRSRNCLDEDAEDQDEA